MTGPGQFPRQPRDRTPVFYGSYDWHSCVEMHWVLVRLLKAVPGAVPAAGMRSALDAQFTPDGLAAEAEYARLSGTGLRHYGWGWALRLMATSWPAGPTTADARRWAAAMEPLAEALAANFLRWLPKATYPTRVGNHPKQLVRAVPGHALRADGGPPRAAGAVAGHPGCRPPLVRRRRRLPGRLGALRARLPVARADRGRADGPAAAARGVQRLARGVPAWPRAARAACRAVHPRRDRTPATARSLPARPQPQPCLVLPAAGRVASPRRPARRGLRRRHAHARRGVSAARRGRPLHPREPVRATGRRSRRSGLRRQPARRNANVVRARPVRSRARRRCA